MLIDSSKDLRGKKIEQENTKTRKIQVKVRNINELLLI